MCGQVEVKSRTFITMGEVNGQLQAPVALLEITVPNEQGAGGRCGHGSGYCPHLPMAMCHILSFAGGSSPHAPLFGSFRKQWDSLADSVRWQLSFWGQRVTGEHVINSASVIPHDLLLFHHPLPPRYGALRWVTALCLLSAGHLGRIVSITVGRVYCSDSWRFPASVWLHSSQIKIHKEPSLNRRLVGSFQLQYLRVPGEDRHFSCCLTRGPRGHDWYENDIQTPYCSTFHYPVRQSKLMLHLLLGVKNMFRRNPSVLLASLHFFWTECGRRCTDAGL
jgi:hypothetical protein